MNKRLVNILKSWPLYTWLLPVFFILHYLSQYYHPSLLGPAARLVIVYLLAATAIALIAQLFFKDWKKAGLLSFLLLSYNFFFGTSFDFLKKVMGHSFLTKYSVILPASFTILVILIIFLKKSKRNFSALNQFLNLLLLVLIIMDLFVLFPKIASHNGKLAGAKMEYQKCDSCHHPDIYLIITDEYAGNTEMKEVLGFDNSQFENDLRSRGFFIIPNTTANYNATVYSIASMLNMTYLDISKKQIVNHPDMLRCRSIINHNNTTSLLEKAGYQIFNNSFFDLAGQPKTISNFYFPSRTALINAGTLLHRFRKDMGAYFASITDIEAVKKNDLNNDKKTEARLKEIVIQKTEQPKFVYSHFYMPHHPYFLDSSGKEILYEDLDQPSIERAYIGYVKYASKKLLETIDYIRNNTSNPPVIIVMGDHGFRELRPSTPHKYYFMNLDAVYLPSGNYTGFYEGMSNVNQFKLVLNNILNQHIPLSKDSTIFLTE